MDDNDHVHQRISYLDHNGVSVLPQHEHVCEDEDEDEDEDEHEDDPYQSMGGELGVDGFSKSYQSHFQLHNPTTRFDHNTLPSSQELVIQCDVGMDKLESRLRDRAASVRAHVRETQRKAQSLTLPKSMALSTLLPKGMCAYLCLHVCACVWQ